MKHLLLKKRMVFFEVEGDPETAAQVAKQLIKEQPWGGVLYFQATVV